MAVRMWSDFLSLLLASDSNLFPVHLLLSYTFPTLLLGMLTHRPFPHLRLTRAWHSRAHSGPSLMSFVLLHGNSPLLSPYNPSCLLTVEMEPDCSYWSQQWSCDFEKKAKENNSFLRICGKYLGRYHWDTWWKWATVSNSRVWQSHVVLFLGTLQEAFMV